MIFYSDSILLWNTFETSNKPNKIWLKGLNPHISKIENLNWIKGSKRNQHYKKN